MSARFGDRPPLRSTLTGGRPPGRKLPDPCWGGLAIIGGNAAKCRPGRFKWEGLFLKEEALRTTLSSALKAAPKQERARGWGQLPPMRAPAPI
jgi:hypothetical protein